MPFIGEAGTGGLRKTPSSLLPPPAPPPELLEAPEDDAEPEEDAEKDEDVECPELGGVDAPPVALPLLSDDFEDPLQLPSPVHCLFAASISLICLPGRDFAVGRLGPSEL